MENDFFTERRVEILKMRCWTLRSYRLPIEMLHRTAEIGKQDFRKEYWGGSLVGKQAALT